MFRRRIAWGLMTLASLYILQVVSPYLTLDPEVFFPQQRATYLAHQGVLFTHVAGAMVALAIGPFMFLNRLRVRWPAVHRGLGRVYLLGVCAGGVAGLMLAPDAYTGATTSAGFAILGLLWLGTGLMAYIRIRAGDVQAHRRWIMSQAIPATPPAEAGGSLAALPARSACALIAGRAWRERQGQQRQLVECP